MDIVGGAYGLLCHWDRELTIEKDNTFLIVGGDRNRSEIATEMLGSTKSNALARTSAENPKKKLWLFMRPPSSSGFEVRGSVKLDRQYESPSIGSVRSESNVPNVPW